MYAGIASIDITPTMPTWMDGMIRRHPSAGVHDPLGARALVLGNSLDAAEACVIVSIDVCAMKSYMCDETRRRIADVVGIPFERIVLAATHTHSGPSTAFGYNTIAHAYVRELIDKLVAVVKQAVAQLAPARAGFAAGREDTISHYRRLLTVDGAVVMNWEPYPPEYIVGPLGEIDPDLGVLQIFAADADRVLCTLFDHTGHPNVMSGDNYLFSADYPGKAMELVAKEFGGMASFVNGVQGTMDIDGLRDRDWEGVERLGTKLAQAVIATARGIVPAPETPVRCAAVRYEVPKRTFTADEQAWIASELVKAKAQTGDLVTIDECGLYGIEHPPVGTRMINPLADGVGSDLLSYLYTEILNDRDTLTFEQVGILVGETAFISFPGELFTEIGVEIKKQSPFAHTYFIGNANYLVGYVPTRKAIGEGSYGVRVRRTADCAEEMVIAQSLALLQNLAATRTM